MRNSLVFLLMLPALLFGVVCFGREVASDPFRIPGEPPETVITADSLFLRNLALPPPAPVIPGAAPVFTPPVPTFLETMKITPPPIRVVQLMGRVKAVRGDDILTAGMALLSRKDDWVLASLTPRLYRKEAIPEKKAVRETTIDALTILWLNKTGEIQASSSVVVKVEERTWDLATYSWVVISSDEMVGYKETKKMRFTGAVRIQDKDHFGTGQRLDYDRASSTVILSGDAKVEAEKWSEKEKKMVKHILTGEKITYDLDTKQASSE
jgi:hypothetical protein